MFDYSFAIYPHLNKIWNLKNCLKNYNSLKNYNKAALELTTNYS